MKLNVNSRTERFTRALRGTLTEPCDEHLEQLRKAVETSCAKLPGTRSHLVKLALNEAEALALQTGFPHLVFPALAEEKVHAIAAWHERQAALQHAEPTLAFAA